MTGAFWGVLFFSYGRLQFLDLNAWMKLYCTLILNYFETYPTPFTPKKLAWNSQIDGLFMFSFSEGPFSGFILILWRVTPFLVSFSRFPCFKHSHAAKNAQLLLLWPCVCFSGRELHGGERVWNQDWIEDEDMGGASRIYHQHFLVIMGFFWVYRKMNFRNK